MKVYFVRHGEATDDIEDRYGGWYDADLSSFGIKQAQELGQKLKEFAPDAQWILSSPFKRAFQTAQELSKILGLKIDTSVYLKERNTYGLLCGENKQLANLNYPELVSVYNNGEEIPGYEPYDIFVKRVRLLIPYLLKSKIEPLICVTHGKLLGVFFKELLKKPAKEIAQNCVVEVEVKDSDNFILKRTDGIQF